MVRATTVTLLAENPQAHGVFDEPEESAREVLCTVRSASYRDIEAAGGMGLRPELVFRLPFDFEYQDEKVLIFDGRRWNIDRVYFADDTDWIELTCSRGDPNV